MFIFEEAVIIDKIKGRNPLLKILIVLVTIQLARMIIRQILFLFIDKTNLNCDITAMITICLLTVCCDYESNYGTVFRYYNWIDTL